MNPQIKFTRKTLDALTLDSSKREREVSCSEVAGLRFVLSKRQKRSWLLRYTIHGHKKSMKLGEYPAMDIEEARRLAREARAEVAKGIDPQATRARQRQLHEERSLTLDRFMHDDVIPFLKSSQRSWRDSVTRYRLHIAPTLSSTPLAEIKTQEIQRLHDRKKAEYCAATANRILALLKRALNLALLWGKLSGHNPVRGVRMHPENNQRHRYLSSDELRRLMAALDRERNVTAAMYVRFLLATGTRKTEALTARWEAIDFEHRRWRLTDTKNKHGRFVILNDMALRVLHYQRAVSRGEYVFQAPFGRPGHLADPARAFKRVLRDAGITDLRQHDCRHAYASVLVQSGLTLQVVAQMLGHKSHLTSARYAHLSSEQLHDAAGRVSAVLENAVAQAS